ncbi:hypothetical protein [Arthrobacter sp. B0490]|uniref:hypothetical protein n=1 Tax=Arthrobacter sp. B0490 TaxID=2058891 RepID=UPI000CE31EE7|nr:hypothetical protein [Arthrobacter sp. B0490]
MRTEPPAQILQAFIDLATRQGSASVIALLRPTLEHGHHRRPSTPASVGRHLMGGIWIAARTSAATTNRGSGSGADGATHLALLLTSTDM